MNNGYGNNPYGHGGNSVPHIQQHGANFSGQPPWGMNIPPQRGQWQGPQFGSRGPMGYQYHQQGFPGQYPQQRPQGHPRQHFSQRDPNFHHRKPNPHNMGNDSNFSNNNRKNKKKKVDKRELPENNKYFCDTCDRGFPSDEKFTEHVDSHQKCSDPTCSYIAAPKLVKMHFQMQHRTGLASKIWQLESKEDVERWIQARKRNYPTSSNIVRKQAMDQDRQARGETINTKTFGKMRGGRHQNQGRGNRKRQWNQSAENDPQNSAKKSNMETQSNVTPDKSSAPGGSDPLAAILHQPHSDNGTETAPDGACVVGGLASIMSSYAVDSDDDESQNTAPVKKVQETRNTSRTLSKSQKKKRKKQHNSNVIQSKRPTLLEQLLAKEIRHERNVILQCVHFIVKKNFFDAGVEVRRSNAGC